MKLHSLLAWAVMLPAVAQGANLVSDTAAAIAAKIPAGWQVASRKDGQVPYGHYWNEEYSGPRGVHLQIRGPATVNAVWRDKRGVQHVEPLAKETLDVYIMPAAYSEGWKRFFRFKDPVAAQLVFESSSARVYAKPSHEIEDEARFNAIQGELTSINWPDSPDRTSVLSWANWRRDLKDSLEKSR